MSCDAKYLRVTVGRSNFVGSDMKGRKRNKNGRKIVMEIKVTKKVKRIEEKKIPNRYLI